MRDRRYEQIEGMVFLGNGYRLDIPEGTEVIKKDAYEGLKYLSQVNIPSTVRIIEAGAFYDCKALSRIHFSEDSNLKTVGASAFGCTGIVDLTLPQGVEMMGNSACSGCLSLKNVALPDSVLKIDPSVFASCGQLERVTLPQGLSVIPRNMFGFCRSLREVIWPKSLQKIEKSAFFECAALLELVGLPRTLGEIGALAFAQSGLRKAQLPNSLQSIGESAFSRCAALEAISFPQKVSDLGQRVLVGCPNLKQVQPSDRAFLEKLGLEREQVARLV